MHDACNVSLSTTIYEWFVLSHGHSVMADCFRRDATLADALDAIDHGTSLHEILYLPSFIADSKTFNDIRDELFDDLAYLIGSTRDDMYNLWLDGASQLDVGSGLG